MGWTNSDNKFGPSSYVVGMPANGLGNGVNFTSIQSAINQAVADGYGPLNPTTILIRPGAYTENISITDGGIALDCATNAISGGAVIIDGNVTLTVSGLNAFSFSNLTFTSSINPTLTITGAAFPFRGSFLNCTFQCSDPGTTGIDISVPSGTFGFANFQDCSILSDGVAINNASRTIVVLENTDCTSLSGSAVVLDSTGRLQAEYCSFTSNASYGVLFNTASNQYTGISTSITAALTAIEMTAGGASTVLNSFINTSDASGFWVVGTGNLTYCDIVNLGSATNIDPGLAVITVGDWKPYSQSGVSPGTGVVRGTAAFDSTQFTTTDGFVQLVAGSGLLTWIDRPGSVAVGAFTGNNATAAVTLTLPTTPANGTECDFVATGAATVVVQAGGTDIIRVGNSTSAAGGTITSTALGDSVRLVYMSSITTWCAIGGPQGNWTIA